MTATIAPISSDDGSSARRSRGAVVLRVADIEAKISRSEPTANPSAVARPAPDAADPPSGGGEELSDYESFLKILSEDATHGRNRTPGDVDVAAALDSKSARTPALSPSLVTKAESDPSTTKTLSTSESSSSPKLAGKKIQEPGVWSVKLKDLPGNPADFPESAKEAKCNDRRHGLRTWYKSWHKQKVQPFWKLTIAQIACVAYILVLTFSRPPVGLRDPSANDIVDPDSAENTCDGVIHANGSYRPVVAVGGWQKFCLAMSRMSAFSMYPMMVAVFVTKMKALQSFLAKTPLSMYFGVIHASHDFHAHAGRYIAFDVWLHTLFHILRWISQGNLRLLWTSAAGLTGLITVVATPLIAFPMMYWKDRISYEVRKALHWLFYVFAVAMCFHVPTTAIPNGGFIAPILGTCIVLYTLDTCYVYLFMTENIETTAFHVLSSGVRISMPVSERFQERAGRSGFAYINIPWINHKQWHAFSLFSEPSDPSTQQMFLLKCGDWTNAVHTALSRDTTRPCWIKGPFPSPYSHASLYDNQILVASGIGITPALAAINAFKSSRRVNLIWAVRDPEMLEFFLEHMYLDHDGWCLIFYTGKKPLASSIESSNTNVKVIRGRPNLASVIPNIIYGVESKEGLPEKYTKNSKAETKSLLIERVSELDINSSMRPTEKLSKLREYGEALGFSLHEMIDEINEFCEAHGAAHSLMDSYHAALNQHDLEATTTDNNAEHFLAELMASMTLVSSVRNNRQCSVQLDDLMSVCSLGDIEQGLCQESRNPPYERKSSYMRWTSVRHVLDKRDFGSLLAPAFHPWKENKIQEKWIKTLSEDVMSTWGIMYCGGSGPVISVLREISIDYCIDLHIDSFAW